MITLKDLQDKYYSCLKELQDIFKKYPDVSEMPESEVQKILLLESQCKSLDAQMGVMRFGTITPSPTNNYNVIHIKNSNDVKTLINSLLDSVENNET